MNNHHEITKKVKAAADRYLSIRGKSSFSDEDFERMGEELKKFHEIATPRYFINLLAEIAWWKDRAYSAEAELHEIEVAKEEKKQP